jgi:hypothetical protein
MLQKKKNEEWGAMTLQKGQFKGDLGGLRVLNEDDIILTLS